MRPPARPPGASGDRRRRPRRDGPGRNALLRRPDARAAGGRHHGHQRKDDDRVPGARPPGGGRRANRVARHGHVRGRGSGGAGGAHHPRGDRPAGHLPPNARRRRPGVRDGGLVPCARARTGDGDHLGVPGVHEPHAGPPRLPPDHGGLLRGQAAPVRGSRARRGQRGRRLRPPARRRARRRHHVRHRFGGRHPRARGALRSGRLLVRMRDAGGHGTLPDRVAGPVQRRELAGRHRRGHAAGRVTRCAAGLRWPGPRVCRGGSSRSRRGRTSRSSWTTLTRPTRSRTCCARRARSPTAACTSYSGQVATATGRSAR